jgi:ABC-type multidrug transport system fused ATPase/permease subunit
LKTLKKAVALLTPHERKRGVLVLILVTGLALFETAGVASVMPFLAILGNPELLQTNSILNALYLNSQYIGVTSPEGFLIVLGVGAFVLIVVSSVYRTFTHYAMNRFIEMRRHSISRRLLETYLRQPYEFFLDRHSGDMSKKILSEVDQLIGGVFRPACNMFAYSLVIGAITILLIMVNIWLALLAAGLLGGLYALVFLLLKRKLVLLGEALVETNKKRFMAAGEAFGGIKDIKLLGRENNYLNSFATPSQQYASTHAHYHTLNQLPNFLIEAIIFGAMLLLTLILMVMAGGLKGGTLGQILPILGLYAFAAYRLKPSVGHVYQGLASLRFGAAAVNSLYEDLYPDNALLEISLPSPNPIKPKKTIALKDVSFTYPKADTLALSDINIEIPVGSSVGLVGSTGAGKTTLIDVIIGLLRPTEGAIIVDGAPITDKNLRAWQRSLGYVPQNIFLADTSMTENIALGIPAEQIDRDHVANCARLAQMHDFISQELPEQYETLVGERGVRLSGGQRQRIGIARALYHNPEVLVLDEATSALDSVTEREVMKAIEALANQKTIFLIAHRLSTVKNCDQIILLEHGRIKAVGNYHDLTENNLQFKKLAEQS